MSLQLHNTKMPEYGETVYSDGAGDTFDYLWKLADARQDFDNDKWMYVGYEDSYSWLELSPKLAREVANALRDEGKVSLAEQLEVCIDEAYTKWGQEAVRLEIW